MIPPTSLPILAPNHPNCLFALSSMEMPLLNHQENGCKFLLAMVLPNLCSLRLCAWFSSTFLVLHMPWHSSLEATAPGSNSNPVTNFLGGIKPLLFLYKKKTLKLINNLPRSFWLWQF